MRKAKLFILVVLLFVTGCSYKYDVVIDKKMKVSEEIVVSELNSVFTSKGTDATTFIDMNINIYNDDNNFSHYNIIKKMFDSSSGVNVSSSYDNFDDYTKKTKVKKNLFGKVELYQASGFGYFIASDYRGELFFTDEETDFKNERVEFNLKLPFEVLDNNADNVDLEKGIYTWYFNKNSIKQDINVKFNLKKIVVKENLIKKFMYLFIGLSFSLLVAFYVIIKNKRVNRI